jgi:hypothetical protein
MPTDLDEAFDESFGDVERIPELRSDELVLWSSPRLRMCTSMLRVSSKLLDKSKAVRIPWLVRLPSPLLWADIQPTISRASFPECMCPYSRIAEH